MLSLQVNEVYLLCCHSGPVLDPRIPGTCHYWGPLSEPVARDIPGGMLLCHERVKVNGIHRALACDRAGTGQGALSIQAGLAVNLFARFPSHRLVLRDAELLSLQLDLSLQNLQRMNLVLARVAQWRPHLFHAWIVAVASPVFRITLHASSARPRVLGAVVGAGFI